VNAPPVITASPPGEIIKKNLYRGKKGEDVVTLQKILIKMSFLKTSPADVLGLYGLKTEQAVKDFQCFYKIICYDSVDTFGWGNIGPKTRTFIDQNLNEASAQVLMPTPQVNNFKGISLGSRGAEVVLMQRRLIEKGFLAVAPTDVLGLYGVKTERAVKSFQCSQNIVCADSPSTSLWGKIDSKTRELILQ
jgi:peptidoglycan hydrolase-like protein with peptidoglycan-binding domain